MLRKNLAKTKILKIILLISFGLFSFSQGLPFKRRQLAPGDESSVPVRLEKREFLTSSGQKLHLLGRSFQAGELIMVSLEIAQPGVQACLIFKQNKLQLYKEETPDLTRELRLKGWLGIDGETEPGVYPLRLIISWPDGKLEEGIFKFEIGRRQFRERKLQVAPAFIQPPAALRERIEREANLLRWVFSLPSSKWRGDGYFILPHQGSLTAFFGDSRVYNNKVRSFHNGVDIKANQGDPVMAANSGMVVVAGSFYFAGNMVVIDHGFGLFTAYNHLSRILVKRGQMVKKGDVIGLAGSSGLSTGAHLHWSARLNEDRIDPTCLLVLPFPSRN